ncbi:MAG: toll/interleukin-1 receptor domain-containing protein [Bacilli bacterium]|nr:toll/interleukin-1 receptor domain-containing protein [Bacilli bacterium]
MNTAYNNKILNIMINQAKTIKHKNILMNCNLEIKWYRMNGNFNECIAVLSCIEDDYYKVINNDEKKKLEDLLCKSIPESDSICIIEFLLNIIDDSVAFEVNLDTVEFDIYKIERYIKFKKFLELVELFPLLTLRYNGIIKKWKNILPDFLKNVKGEWDYEKIQHHSLELIKILKEHCLSFQTREQNFTESKQKNKQNDKEKEYDVFISHANLDKVDYVSDLKKSISKLNVNVFYDADEIEWGDEWEKRILDGIEKSRFAILVLSKNFFGRTWTEIELSSFLSKQNSNKQKIILPLLYGVTLDEVLMKYPFLSKIHFIDSEKYSIDEVTILFARQLIKDLK